uniref:Protein kinase domain-containing protein n=1 Tax=Calidris pygmaea TaxID=425635 RepID=A0A8C3JFI1_9CHAR
PTGATGSQELVATLSPGNVEDLYELLETLGSGHFGVVKRCRERSTGHFYAAKAVKTRRCRGSRWGLEKAQVEREGWGGLHPLPLPHPPPSGISR